ncbi:MAG: hypothetical protein NT062_20865 [Proteobacteria bacterium]|nr:hypothetical protein [Pseudomonadota bacterium]
MKRSELRVFVGLVLVLGACESSSGGPCAIDNDCSGGERCARTMECLPDAEIRSVRAEWTVGGQPPSAASCAVLGPLQVSFYGDYVEDAIGFAPVPCVTGVFTIDKLPTRFYDAQLGPENGLPRSASLDAEGIARFDL